MNTRDVNFSFKDIQEWLPSKEAVIRFAKDWRVWTAVSAVGLFCGGAWYAIQKRKQFLANPRSQADWVDRLLVGILNRVVQRGANTPNADNTQLARAVDEGNVRRVQLFARSADLATANLGGRPLLHVAVEKGDLPIVSLLIENGADVNVAHNNSTALHLAAASGKVDLVRRFIQCPELRLNAKVGDPACTALELAVDQGHEETVREFFKSPRLISTWAMHTAFDKRNYSMMNLLMRLGVNIKQHNDVIPCVLQLATNAEDKTAVTWLKERGATLQ